MVIDIKKKRKRNYTNKPKTTENLFMGFAQ